MGSIGKCVLHTGIESSNEQIKPFTTETLQKCTLKKQIRDSEQKRGSKYDKIVLPEIANGVDGYHPSCYRYFCSIKSKCHEIECKSFFTIKVLNVCTKNIFLHFSYK